MVHCLILRVFLEVYWGEVTEKNIFFPYFSKFENGQRLKHGLSFNKPTHLLLVYGIKVQTKKSEVSLTVTTSKKTPQNAILDSLYNYEFFIKAVKVHSLHCLPCNVKGKTEQATAIQNSVSLMWRHISCEDLCNKDLLDLKIYCVCKRSVK